MIGVAIIFALNIDFSSTPKITANTAVSDKNAPAPKPNPDKEKWLAGKDLFKANCASCHNPKSDGVGPPLVGVRNLAAFGGGEVGDVRGLAGGHGGSGKEDGRQG